MSNRISHSISKFRPKVCVYICYDTKCIFSSKLTYKYYILKNKSDKIKISVINIGNSYLTRSCYIVCTIYIYKYKVHNLWQNRCPTSNDRKPNLTMFWIWNLVEIWLNTKNMIYVLFIKLTVLYLSICQRQSVICSRQLTFVERVLEEPLKTDIASTNI